MVVLHVGIQASQVETVGEVVFIDFTKVLVPPRCDELKSRLSARYSKDNESTGLRNSTRRGGTKASPCFLLGYRTFNVQGVFTNASNSTKNWIQAMMKAQVGDACACCK